MNKQEPKKIWVIRWSGSGFYMTGPGDELVENKPTWKPRDFSKYAWDKGADEVKHDYDGSKYGRD